jgi:hypothetical protein
VYLLQLLDVSAPWAAVRQTVPTYFAGGYLVAYDPEVGMASLVVGDKTQALRFADGGEAMALWRSVPSRQPTRPDGKPNRPLTSFTIAIANENDQ